MTPSDERAIRAAADGLATALIDALDHEVARTERVDRLYSIADACRLLGIRRTALYGLIARGEVRSLKVGGRRLVSGHAIAEVAGR
jgi:excisionase family DNA binding protein